MHYSNFEDVGAFHARFGLPETTYHMPRPFPVDRELADFRVKFMQEELDEFKDALSEADFAKMFDALIDLVYVAMGTAHLFGFPWQRGWAAVQDANMAKVRAQADGSDSVRGSSWDVVKPEGWEPPDIEGILRQIGW